MPRGRGPATHLPEDLDDLLVLVRRSDFFHRWSSHLASCSVCATRVDQLLEAASPEPPEMPVPASLEAIPRVAPTRNQLRRWGLLGVGLIVVAGTWLTRGAIVPRPGSIEILFRTECSNLADASEVSRALSVHIVPGSGKPPLDVTAQLSQSSGLARLVLNSTLEGTVRAETATGRTLAGFGRVQSGTNVVVLGGPGSAAFNDHAVAQAIDDGSNVGRKIVSSLPFGRVDVAEAAEVVPTPWKLDREVSVAYIDDLAVYDGSSLIWSEDFESTAPGGYPPMPVRPLSPSPRPGPSTDDHAEIPQGIVVDSRAAGGSHSFQCLSLPRRARIDGIPLGARDLRTDQLAYEASVLLTTADARGLLLALKEDTDAPDEWRDKAALLFSFGEIRTWCGNQLLGSYEPGRWYHLRVVVDLTRRTMSVWVDALPLAIDVPADAPLPSLRKEYPDLDRDRIGFDSFAFGGIFFGEDEARPAEQLPIVSHAGTSTTFQLAGDRPGWQPTGIVLRAGERVAIHASGEIHLAGRSPNRTNPDGCDLSAADPCGARYVQDPRYPVPVPTAWCGALVGRIGGAPGFFLGSGVQFTADRDGELTLAYNDNYHGDNSGSFLVTVAR